MLDRTSQQSLQATNPKISQLRADLSYQERLLAESINATCLREGERGRTQRRDMIHRIKQQLAALEVAR